MLSEATRGEAGEAMLDKLAHDKASEAMLGEANRMRLHFSKSMLGMDATS